MPSHPATFQKSHLSGSRGIGLHHFGLNWAQIAPFSKNPCFWYIYIMLLPSTYCVSSCYHAITFPERNVRMHHERKGCTNLSQFKSKLPVGPAKGIKKNCLFFSFSETQIQF